MAQKSINLFLEDKATLDDLNISYNEIIDEVQLKSVSVALKNNTGYGNANAGTYKFNLGANALVKPYKTARTAGKGDAVSGRVVLVNLDDDIEIVEEYESTDEIMGNFKRHISSLKNRHASSLVRYLDKKFFETASTEGSESSATVANAKGLETVIGEIQTVSNTIIDGVERDNIALVLSTKAYSSLRTEIDTLPATDNTIANGNYGKFHGVDIYVSNHLPVDVEVVGMMKGAIAQPFYSKQYQAEKLPLSNAFAVQLFAKQGTKALYSETIKVIKTPAGK